MGPPPPSPRIEGQQHQHPPNHYRKPRPSVASSAPPLSSYASLASAPPPSFARKASTASSSGDGTSASASRSSATAASLAATDYRASPRGSATSLSYGGGRTGGGGGGRSGAGGRTSRYDTGGGRGPRGGGSFGAGRGGGRGRYDDRFGSGSARNTSTGGESRAGRGGRGSEEGTGGRGFYRRGGGGGGGGRDTSGSGRFDSTSRGRGRGRDYMYTGGRGRGRAFRGRGNFNRDESGGRGRYGDSTYGGNDASYSSFGDSGSVGEITHPRSSSFSDDLPAEGPSPGEITNQGGYGRSSSTGSDGGRSMSPHPPQQHGGARRPYGSFSNNSSNTNEPSTSEFRRSASQEEDPEPGEEDPNSYYAPPASSSSAKRRREDSYVAAATGEESEPPKQRLARDALSDPPSEGGPPPLPFGPSADSIIAAEGPPSAESSGSRGNANELADEGRWTSPSGVSTRDSPHATRRLYNSSTAQFDDAGSEGSAYRESSSFGGRGGSGGGGGRGGRGRGRTNYRTGRGTGRGGAGAGAASDYTRTTSGEYSSQREYGGRYGAGSDRRLSITASNEGNRAPELSPRPFAQYADLASTAAPSWRRHESDEGAPPLSPRGGGGTSDWRKPTTAPRVISSYATLATNPPPPRPSPSPSKAPIQAVMLPRPQTPEPEKVQTPPPSPGPPSGLTIALTRLADLEAQMEFAHTKHVMLVKRHQVLMAQYEHLEGLPVGLDAFAAELQASIGADRAKQAEDAALYG